MKSRFILILFNFCLSYYLPGFAPTEYLEGTRLEMKSRKMKSAFSQTDKRYYELNFCKPNSTYENTEFQGNLGESLIGDFLEPSDYIVFWQ